MKKIIILSFLVFSLVDCKKDPQEIEIGRAIRKKDVWKIAILCADYKGKKYIEDCQEYTEKAESEINSYISQKKDLPFFKLMIEKKLDADVRTLLERNIHLGIKYRIIWEEISEKHTGE